MSGEAGTPVDAQEWPLDVTTAEGPGTPVDRPTGLLGDTNALDFTVGTHSNVGLSVTAKQWDEITQEASGSLAPDVVAGDQHCDVSNSEALNSLKTSDNRDSGSGSQAEMVADQSGAISTEPGGANEGQPDTEPCSSQPIESPRVCDRNLGLLGSQATTEDSDWLRHPLYNPQERGQVSLSAWDPRRASLTSVGSQLSEDGHPHSKVHFYLLEDRPSSDDDDSHHGLKIYNRASISSVEQSQIVKSLQSLTHNLQAGQNIRRLVPSFDRLSSLDTDGDYDEDAEDSDVDRQHNTTGDIRTLDTSVSNPPLGTKPRLDSFPTIGKNILRDKIEENQSPDKGIGMENTEEDKSLNPTQVDAEMSCEGGRSPGFAAVDDVDGGSEDIATVDLKEEEQLSMKESGELVCPDASVTESLPAEEEGKLSVEDNGRMASGALAANEGSPPDAALPVGAEAAAIPDYKQNPAVQAWMNEPDQDDVWGLDVLKKIYDIALDMGNDRTKEEKETGNYQLDINTLKDIYAIAMRVGKKGAAAAVTEDDGDFDDDMDTEMMKEMYAKVMDIEKPRPPMTNVWSIESSDSVASGTELEGGAKEEGSINVMESILAISDDLAKKKGMTQAAEAQGMAETATKQDVDENNPSVEAINDSDDVDVVLVTTDSMVTPGDSHQPGEDEEEEEVHYEDDFEEEETGNGKGDKKKKKKFISQSARRDSGMLIVSDIAQNLQQLSDKGAETNLDPPVITGLPSQDNDSGQECETSATGDGSVQRAPSKSLGGVQSMDDEAIMAKFKSLHPMMGLFQGMPEGMGGDPSACPFSALFGLGPGDEGQAAEDGAPEGEGVSVDQQETLAEDQTSPPSATDENVAKPSDNPDSLQITKSDKQEADETTSSVEAKSNEIKPKTEGAKDDIGEVLTDEMTEEYQEILDKLKAQHPMMGLFMGMGAPIPGEDAPEEANKTMEGGVPSSHCEEAMPSETVQDNGGESLHTSEETMEENLNTNNNNGGDDEAPLDIQTPDQDYAMEIKKPKSKKKSKSKSDTSNPPQLSDEEKAARMQRFMDIQSIMGMFHGPNNDSSGNTEDCPFHAMLGLNKFTDDFINKLPPVEPPTNRSVDDWEGWSDSGDSLDEEEEDMEIEGEKQEEVKEEMKVKKEVKVKKGVKVNEEVKVKVSKQSW